MNDLTLKVGFDIAKFQSELNRTSSMMQSWGKQITGYMISAFTIDRAVTAFQRGITEVITSAAEFQHSMQEVKAITGASGQEFDKLKNNAIQMAGAFKAIDISRMEVELGRLGFTTQEIIDTTKASIQLSVATGENLARGADVLGSTLRAFNLNASESARVADVMASGFNNSALSLENFAEAIKYVAPVAANAGISLEQTTALLGVLADNGIKGSMAGTSLRKIISDLGQGAAPVLNQKLREMAVAGMSGAEAMDEVGRTAYASLLILSKNTEKIDQYTKANESAKGSAAAMAKIMQDDLVGSWKNFNAELEKTYQGKNFITDYFKTIIDEYTAMVKLINMAINGQDQLNKKTNETTAPANPGFRAAMKAGAFDNNPVQKPMGTRGGTEDLQILSQQWVNDIDQAGQAFAKLKSATYAETNELENFNAEQYLANDALANFSEEVAPEVQSQVDTLTEKFVKQRNAMNMLGLSTRQWASHIRNAIAQSAQAIGAGIAALVTGAGTVEQAVSQMAVGVISALENVALAYMIANAAQYGPLGILGAAAGFELVKALFAQLGSNAGASSVGGAAVSRHADRGLAMQSIHVEVRGEFKLAGSTLRGVINKSNYNQSIAGGG